jgi:phosphate-selective porin OprO/OprP
MHRREISNWTALVVIALGMQAAMAADPLSDFDNAAVPPPPAVIANEESDLPERVKALEAELGALRNRLNAGGVTPANAEFLPPPPALYEGGYRYLASPPPAVPAPPKYPNVTVNGFLQADSLWFGQDAENRANVGDIQDGAGFRRTRLSAKGAVAENVNYLVQMDFGAIGRPTFTDVWGEITHVPVLGNVRVGQWKQPFGLESVTSVRYQPFLERSLLFQTFQPFRHIGAGFYDVNEDQTATWAASVFRTGQDQYGNDITDDGGISTAGRVTWLPYFEDHLDKTLDYLHLGMAYWFGAPSNQRFRYATIPEAFVGAFGSPAGAIPGTSRVNVPSIANGTPPFADTGNIETNMFLHLGSEFLWVRGPLSFQSETMLANVEQTARRPLLFWGSYFEGSYFLTGESRTYDRKVGALDRITPIHSFLRDECGGYGPGAWEVLFRVSHVDLSANNIRGGYQTDLTAGLNWYLNGYTKFQLNYVRAMLDKAPAGDSRADIAGVRFQVDF